jgi:hypothetical protein
MKLNFFLISSFFALLAPHQATLAAEFSIMAWGAQATDLASPYVNELRHACYIEPTLCVQRSSQNAKIQLTSLSFAQPEKIQENIEKAVAFSEISKSQKSLREVSIDDFFSFAKKLKVENKSSYIDRLISSSKSKNPDLQFGVTVYENELANIEKDSATFSKEILAKINRVALYLHYRKNGPSFDSYVKRAKSIFPNAKIYGGVYHYDRSDYIRCDQRAPGKCSPEEEINLYVETLQVQTALLKKNEISGLEFYPGFLGREAAWPAWSKGKSCSTKRISQCIGNSQKMTVETLRILKTLSN